MFSESFTTSLRSVNSPAFIKKYDKRANCLLSRSCHHCLVGAIIGPRPIRTRECARADMRERARASTSRPRELPPRYSHSFVKLAVICTVFTTEYYVPCYYQGRKL